jgi:hypothetical protein
MMNLPQNVPNQHACETIVPAFLVNAISSNRLSLS